MHKNSTSVQTEPKETGSGFKLVEPTGQPEAHRGQRNKDWRREYYIPDYSIQRAARDLLMNSTFEESEVFAGRMFALQDTEGEEAESEKHEGRAPEGRGL
jgi:hypothetical protein